MLVLKLKIGERVYIGEDTYITLTEAGKGYARLAVATPRSKSVLRQKLISEEDRLKIENTAREGGPDKFRVAQ